MPFFIGGHPGFQCPLYPEEVFSDYQIVFEKEEHSTNPKPETKTGLILVEERTKVMQDTRILPLDHSLFAVDAIIFDELESKKVQLVHKIKGHGIQLEFQDFPYLVLWSTSNRGPFVAMEPWTGLSTCSDEDDIFEHKRNVQILDPGEEKDYSHTIEILV